MRAIRLRRTLLTIALATSVTPLAIAPAGTASAATTYASYAYIAASRQGSAVYINGLVQQNSASGLIRSVGRTVYVQRKINGGWQNILVRTTNTSGRISVGYVSVVSYPYRLVVLAKGSAAAATSGTSTPPVLVIKFANCTDANKYYAHGIGKVGAVDHTSSTPVKTFFVNNSLYQANTALDRDKDGIACERL